MDKLKMHSLDGVKRNIERIGKLFPNAITEVIFHCSDTISVRKHIGNYI